MNPMNWVVIPGVLLAVGFGIAAAVKRRGKRIEREVMRDSILYVKAVHPETNVGKLDPNEATDRIGRGCSRSVF